MAGKGAKRFYPPTEDQTATGMGQPFTSDQPATSAPLMSPFASASASTPSTSTPYTEGVPTVPLLPNQTGIPQISRTGPASPFIPTTPFSQPPSATTPVSAPPSAVTPSYPPPTTSPVAPPPATESQQTHQDFGGHQKRRVYIDPEGQTSYEEPMSSGTQPLTSGMGNLSISGAVPTPTGATTAGPQLYNPQTTGYPTPSAQTMTSSPQSAAAFNEPQPFSIAANFQCPPLFMRTTLSAVPSSTSLLNKTGIPFGCVIHPLAKPPTKEDRIPVINFGSCGILRCRRCRAYINPFVTFVEAGRRWRCNLCGLPNDVPSEYFSPVDQSGRRQDLDERPELSKGAVEFVAPSEYMVRPPMPATYMFVIDVSHFSLSSGMFQTVVETIKRVLNSFPGNPRTRIGFITFDSTVHFYNLKSGLSSPQMLVLTDIEDVFLPLPDDMLVNLVDSKSVIEALLNKFPKMFPSSNIAETAVGVALKAAYEIMKNIGGKVLLFSNSLPAVGAGKLKNREDPKLLGTDKETSLLVAEDNYYKNFALDCSRQQISVDCFLFSSQFTDVSTVGCLSQFTGGQVYYYGGFKSDRDGESLYRDIIRDLTRETGFEAVMRFRTSKGLKTVSHFGNFFIRSTDLLALPNVDADKAFGVQLALADSTVSSKYVSFQAALLYTTSFGERRIRVFTQCLPVTSSMVDIFKSVDCEAIIALTAKMAIEKALTSRLSDAREALVNKCIDILSVYRSDLAPQSNTSQLMLPETMKLLPLYILALIKHVTFRAGTEIRPDERTYHMMIVRNLPVSLTIPFIYPRLFALHNMQNECGTVDPNNGAIILPSVLNLSSEKLDRTGVFLMEDGYHMFMWFGKLVNPDILINLFGISSLESVDTSQLRLVPLENEFSTRVNAIVDDIRTQRPMYMDLAIVREGEPREVKFYTNLVEDRTKSVHSYYEFLVNLHQRIQARIMKK